MSGIKNIILETRTEELENLLSPFIREQFPNFIRTDYPKLVLFIKAYYEWMEQKGNAGYVVAKLDSVFDVDANAEEFYDHFKKTYLASFPELFAVNPDGKTPNKKTLLKKIRDFYGNKGTESAYKFLFRILYDSDLELYYPKTDILKASDGQWIEPRSIKTTSNNAADLFGGKNGQIYQYSGTQLVASAFINSVVQYSFNGLPVTEFFITDINGTFSPDQTVVITKDGTEWRETTYSVLGGFFIELPGSGYRIGDTVTVTDSRGVGFAAKIEQTGLAGSIKKIGISNSGLNYTGNLLVNIFSEGGAQSAKVFALRSAVTNYVGYFSGNRGKISSNKKIQDGHYYQDFSYELKSEVSLDTYFDILKKIIHPAGMRMFGSVLVKKAIDNTVTSSTQATYSETPVVGRYAPYALRTFNDLRGGYFLPNQVQGATLQVWLSAYNLSGNTSTGITANWVEIVKTATIGETPGGSPVTAEDIWGINRWDSAVGGHQFLYSAAYPNSNVWLTPNLKRETVNTHSSVDFRPIQYNFSGPSNYSRLVSLGLSGPTMGRLGLTLSTSYFAVAKPERIGNIGAFGTLQTTGRVLLGDRAAYRGIIFGLTGSNLTIPQVAAFSWRGSSQISGIVGSIGKTGEWKLISHTLTCSTGNSGPMSLFVDGVCLGTVTQAWTPNPSNEASSLQIAQQRFDSLDGAFDGEIAEVLCYQGDVGEADRQKIEGYLAHKYGLAGNLPSTHPYKNTVPGGSYSSGKWYGTTGDFYPNGYNPYIGSTAQVGVDGSTAPLGSQFLDSGLGYSYTVCDEFGVTAHNPTGSPLGGTAAWYANRESNLTPEGMNGLVLWLKPENIGVCGSVVNGASADVWTDSSPQANHALPPTWDKWNGVADITKTLASSTGWNRSVYSTNPVTKLSFVANGVCGGFTTGRLFMLGMSENATVHSGYTAGIFLYSIGPYDLGSGPGGSVRRYILYASDVNNVVYAANGAEIIRSNNVFGLDNTVIEMEYVQPNVIIRADGVEKRRIFVGFGKTYYIDSSFYLAGSDVSNPASVRTSITLLETSYNGTPVVPALAASHASTFNISVYAGVTIDKLRPTLQTAGFGGATGISFNGGLVFAPASTYRGVTLGGVVGLGYTTGPGSSAAAMLTGHHLYLRKPMKITDDADIFVVYKTTRDGLSFGYGLLGSRNTNCDLSAAPSVRFDSVLFSRSYNEQDRTAAQQNSTYYTVLPNGTLLYPGASLPPAGVFGFRPCGDQTGVLQNSIVYDPHVSGACLGICVGEAVRDSFNKIEVFLNGDRGLNKSRSTGRRVASIVPPSADNWVTTKNLVYGFDAGKTASLGEFVTAKTANLLDPYPFRETPLNFIGPIAPSMWGGDGSPSSAVLVTQDGGASIGTDEVYEMTTGTSGNIFLNRGTGGGAAAGAWIDSTTTSTTWTASFTIRRDDGSVISGVGVYLYTPDNDGSAPGTIEDLGGGWYRVTRTKTLTTAAAANTLIGLTGLGVGVKYRIGRVFLQPFSAGSDVAGTTIRSNASYPVGYLVYGTATANEVGYKTGPSGYAETVWHGKNHSTINTVASFNPNVGFNSPAVTIDRTKLYRYSVWVKRAVLNNGNVYFGNGSAVLKRSDGTTDTNPYFDSAGAAASPYVGKQNQWVLVVGHIHPVGSGTGSNHPNSGYYLPNSGTTYSGLDASYGDKVWTSTNTTDALRVFLYGSNNRGEEAQFARPRIEVVDGSEISIEDLTSGSINTVYDLSTTGAISQVLNEVGYSSDGGGCVVFNGGPGVISTNTSLVFGSNRNITWEAWVNPSVGGGHDMYMGAGGLPYFDNYSGGRLLWSVSQAGVQAVIQSAPAFFTAGAWHHVVCVSEYDGTTTRYTVYKNGVKIITTGGMSGQVVSTDTSTIGLVGQEYLTDTSGVSNNGNVVFSIGNRSRGARFAQSGEDYAFRGSVSTARVYSRALTPEEITQNFNSLRGRFGL